MNVYSIGTDASAIQMQVESGMLEPPDVHTMPDSFDAMRAFSGDHSKAQDISPWDNLWIVPPGKAFDAYFRQNDMGYLLPFWKDMDAFMVCFPKPKSQDLTGRDILNWGVSDQNLVARTLCFSTGAVEDKDLPYGRPDYLKGIPIKGLYFVISPLGKGEIDLGQLAAGLESIPIRPAKNLPAGMDSGVLGPWLPGDLINGYCMYSPGPNAFTTAAYFLKGIIFDAEYLKDYGDQSVFFGAGGLSISQSIKPQVKVMANLGKAYSVLCSIFNQEGRKLVFDSIIPYSNSIYRHP